MQSLDSIPIGRRAFLKNGSLLLAAVGVEALASSEAWAIDNATSAELRIGLVTDLHYADKPSNGNRYYRETLDKLAEASTKFRECKPTLVVELGDLIDATDSVQNEQHCLQRINKIFSAISKDRHYVLGNHCVYTLTKREFLNSVEREQSYYSFDRGHIHFVVLDACFRSDGTPYGRRNFDWTDACIPAAQIEWLRSDLESMDKKAVVFAHQRLDVTNHYGVKNAHQIRQVLEGSGKVLAVIQGHNHKNDYSEIGGIHYCTLMAMVEGGGPENNCYSLMSIWPDGTIRITGYRKQTSYAWESE